jgi:hypothetical protein
VLGALAYIVYALWFLQHEKRMAGGTSTAERQTGAEGSVGGNRARRVDADTTAP